jgi:hypothetical protein
MEKRIVNAVKRIQEIEVKTNKGTASKEEMIELVALDENLRAYAHENNMGYFECLVKFREELRKED